MIWQIWRPKFLVLACHVWLWSEQRSARGRMGWHVSLSEHVSPALFPTLHICKVHIYMASHLWYCYRPSPLTPGVDYSGSLPLYVALTSSVFAQFMLTISVATPSSYCLLDGKSINGGQGQLIPRSISCSRKEIIANLQSDRCISILIGVIWPKH